MTSLDLTELAHALKLQEFDIAWMLVQGCESAANASAACAMCEQFECDTMPDFYPNRDKKRETLRESIARHKADESRYRTLADQLRAMLPPPVKHRSVLDVVQA